MKNSKMKILVISNLYPPNYIGGYELFCKDVVDTFLERGHKVYVLTSKSDYKNSDKYIGRNLHLIGSFEKGEGQKIAQETLKNIKKIDQNEIKKQILVFKPDVIYVWHMANFHKNLMNTLIESCIPIVYHFEDRWIPSFYYEMFSYFLGIRISYVKYLIYEIWTMGDIKSVILKILNRLKRLAKKERQITLDPLPKLDIRKSIFLSRALRKEHEELGFNTDGSIVIYNGIDISKFRFKKKRKHPGVSPKILFVGRVAEKKGIQTLIKALGEIRKEHYSPTLTVVGEADDFGFLGILKKMSKRYRIQDRIKFIGSIERSEIPKFYQTHDILVFPSIWEEPFGLVLIEAMCAKLPVISTSTGGTKEFLKHNFNCLIFKPADYISLANHIKTLCNSKKIYERLSKNSYIFVKTRFTLKKSVDKIEKYLQKSIN